ncbi:hypothetical protein CJ010_16860 [Azoarcus sp. DD4]|uniref:DUF2149 domain-containing protein n=1 Tax=Azoarcus sp. DD4 TaxID=2027405 RepID=UPI00112ECB41|nr:DUF2149 domain-containing protein [Azoarcus sp. DD4]QDF98087.1 hypothetical protein CJ010_16860 [Azoarcus sp. DD4]
MTHKHLSILGEDDDDPMLSAVNLVDVFLVLVVALLTAVALQKQKEADEDVTIIRNAGKPDMEIVVRKDGHEVKYRGNGGSSDGQGVRAGVAYKMKDGSIIYVPEAEASAATAPAEADQ